MNSHLPTSVLVISPHRDDAVFSCGGFMAQLAAARRKIVVLNVFAGSIERAGAVSPFARNIVARAGLDLATATSVRLREDITALALFNAERIDLNYLDAAFRGDTAGKPLYPDDDTLKAGLVLDAFPLYEQISDELYVRAAAMNEDDWVLAPAAIGNHVDHVICHQAMLSIALHARFSARVLFYEDFPYVANQLYLAGRSPLLSGSVVTHLTSPAFALKVDAGLSYTSQIRLIWGSADAFKAEIKRFSLLRGGGKLAEVLVSSQPHTIAQPHS